MSNQNPAPDGTPSEGVQKSGSWWKFVALILGAPPLAVYGAEEEVEAERAARRAD